MKEKLIFYKNNYRNEKKYEKYYKRSLDNSDGYAADIIRLTHSIEKGLCLKKIKTGFGHEKQKKIIDLTSKLDLSNNYYQEVVNMVVSAFKSYLDYHKSIKYEDDFLPKIREYIKKYDNNISKKYGGIIKIKKEDLDFNINNIEYFFKTRHSIRDFSKTPVDKSVLLKAIKLAQTSPSACNRQGYRIHIADTKKNKDIINWLSGVGGFADSIDKVLLITAKVSSYSYNESYQYIVSASIFAAYLSLTLHLYGLGSCIIQRPVTWTKKWDDLRKKYKINSDEQIICVIGVGNLTEEFNVPVSHRLSTEQIVDFLD